MKFNFPDLSSTILRRLLVYFSLATIPLVALAFYLVVDERRQEDASAMAEEGAATHVVEEEVGLAFQLTRTLVTGIANERSESEICRFLQGNLHAYPQLSNLTLFSVRNGEPQAAVLCSAIGVAIPGNLLLMDDEMRAITELKRAGDVTTAYVRPNAVNGRAVIPIAALVSDRPDGSRWLVSATIDLDWLNRQVNRLHVPEQAALLVVDSHGIIAARNPPSKSWPVGKPAPKFERTLPQRGDFAGEIIGPDDGISRYYTVRRIGSAGGMVVLMKRRSSVIFAASHRRLVLNLVSILGIFTLMFAVAWRHARRHLANPLRKLSHAADRLAAGALTVRTGMDYRGEIGGLARSFDSMASAIQIEAGKNQDLIKSLRESERRFREHLESVQLVAVMVDNRGVLTFCNDYFLNLTGFSRREVMGRPALDFVAPEERERSRYPADGLMPLSVENRILTKNGSTRLIRWNNTHLRDEAGAFLGLCGLGVDITEHRALLEQRLQSDRLESLGRLAAGVAHDFNNLLTVINGYSDLVLSRLPEPDPLRKSLQEVRKAGEQAAGLTRQLLTFSRAQAVEPKPVGLNQLIRESESMFGQLLGGQVQLETSLAPETGPILADKAQLQQVLLNLITNAMHAMPEGGVVRIETSLAEHPERQAGEWVLLTISDTGLGMSPETLGHIFDPFYTTRRDGKGTGLGLSIVYGIVQQSNGYLEVGSKPGLGTTFSIWWPRADASPASEANAAGRSSTGSETILLVEDRDEVRGLMVAVLEKSGYRVHAASSADHALQLAGEASEPIDLLLTDVVMPGMNGRELANRLLARDPELKVVFMSGFAAEIFRPANAKEPPVEFIQKPMTGEALSKKIRQVLDTRYMPA